MTHVMLDFETLGLRPGSVLLSIGAKFFSPTGPSIFDTKPHFYANISPASCVSLGMTEDASTVEWWQSPDKQEAWLQLQNDQVNLSDAMIGFVSWFEAHDGQYIWSQGSCFDVVLAEDALRRVGIPVPWKFWNIRDTRTIYDAFGLNPKWIKREGTFHNALDDVTHQIKCVQESYARASRR